MRYKYSGICSCGEVCCEATLPNKLSCYSPRVCDCDFCLARNVGYVSDPNGFLSIDSKTPLKATRQGSQQATFLLCSSCETFIAVSFDFSGQAKAALNANLLQDYNLLGKSELVSPKLLSPSEKLQRWGLFWMPVQLSSSGD